MNKVISVENLYKSYKTGKFVTKVLEGITFDVNEGDIVFIVGPSGAGKTTLLNILGLMDDFDSGKYILMGKDTTTLNKNQKNYFVRNYIGFLFQTIPLLSELTVYENIVLPLKISGIKGVSFAKVEEVCYKLGIEQFLSRRITEISTGQRQRVGLAGVLLKQPKILLCDEPTANLDNENTQKMLQLLNEINKKDGVTIIFASHNISLAHFATKIYKISYGQIQSM